MEVTSEGRESTVCGEYQQLTNSPPQHPRPIITPGELYEQGVCRLKSRVYVEEESKWKYVVLMASFISHLLIYGVAWGAGVFQMMFMDVFGKVEGAGTISIIPTLVSSCLAFVGPLASVGVNRVGCRGMTILGSVAMGLGFVLSSFAPSVLFLCFSFTLIGIGCGLAYIPSVVVVCDYFENKRPIAVALSSSGLGVGIFMYPPLVRVLDYEFGWRGALLMCGALSLNVAVCGSVFRPVVKQPIVHEVCRKKKILRVKMLKELPYLCYILNNVLCLYGIVAFYIHMPEHAKNVGYSENESAMFVSITGAATVVARILCGIAIQRLDAPIAIYALSMTAGAVAVCIVPFVHSTPLISAACLVFGLGTATLGPSMPLILAELVGPDAMGDGYGYIMVAEGLGSLVGPPVSGFIYDATSSYTVSLCVSGAGIILGSLLMLVPLYSIRRKRLTALVLANISGKDPLDTHTQPRHTWTRTLSEKPLLDQSFSVDSNASSVWDPLSRQASACDEPRKWNWTNTSNHQQKQTDIGDTVQDDILAAIVESQDEGTEPTHKDEGTHIMNPQSNTRGKQMRVGTENETEWKADFDTRSKNNNNNNLEVVDDSGHKFYIVTE